MKNRIVLVLIVAFVAATALVLHSAEKEEVRRIRHIEIRKTAGNETMMPAGLIKLFKIAEELELTNPQLLQLRMLFQKQTESRKKLKEEKKQFKNLNDSDLSEEEVRKLAAEKAKQLEESIIARFKMQQEIKKIFTPEQLKKLEELNAKKPARKGPPMMPFWQKPGADRKGPPAMWRRHTRDKKEAKPGVEKHLKHQTKDSTEALVEEMESVLDDIDSGE